MFRLAPPPGFQGFDPRGELTVYQRHLPHWRQKGASYFVTFRLADSLPQTAVRQLKQLREELTAKLPPDSDGSSKDLDDINRMLMVATERWLDQGLGTCLLKQAEARQIVYAALRALDGLHYELGTFVIMPNHVHAIVRPLDDHALEDILQRRKQWSSNQINKLEDRSGKLWQHDSYDRIIRDSEHLWRVLQYIGNNPHKAGIDARTTTRWVRPEWQELGWEFINK